MSLSARAIAILALLALAGAPGCRNSGSAGGTGSSAASPAVPIVAASVPAEAPPVGAFINDASTTELLLDQEVGLEADAAREIVAARDGVGQTPTAIIDKDDLEPIQDVGPVAIERVERFAANWSSVNPDPLLAFLNDPATTFSVLRAIKTASGSTSLPSATAQAIIDHRASGDRFDSRSEVLEVGGVGIARLQDIEARASLGRTLAIDAETTDDLRAVAFAKDGTLALVVGRSDAGAAAWIYDPTEEESFAGDVLGEDESAESPGFAIRQMTIPAQGSLDLHDVAFAPDGRSAIAVGEGGKALRFDRETRAWTDISPPASLQAGVLTSVAFAPSGNAALVADVETGRVLRYDVARAEWTAMTAVDASGVAYSDAPAFASTRDGGVGLAASERGRLVAIQGVGRTVLETNAVEGFDAVAARAGSGEAMAVGGRGLAFSLRFRPGTLAAQAVAVVDLERVATRSIRDLHAAAFAPSGAYVLMAGDHGELLRHDPTRGSTSRLTVRRVSDPDEAENRNFHGVAFAPDGSYAIVVGDHGALFRYEPGP